MDLDELKRRLHYDPENGVFIWVEPRCVRIKPGDRAGSRTDQGYRRIEIFNRQIKEHRLAWFYMTGEWAEIIDHINGVRDDNRWVNLRAATDSGNRHNVQITSRSTSGVKGLHWHKRDRCWQAHIRLNKKVHQRQFHPSTFGGCESAKQAAIDWIKHTRELLHGEFANHG